MSLKKKRIEFSQAEKDMLTSAWDAGMKSVSDHNEIKKISAQLNICEKRIEAWIGNKRAQARGYFHNYRKKAKALKYGPNAYSLFVGKQRRGNLPPGEFLKTAALNYRQLDIQEKKRLKEEAKAVRETKLKGMTRKDIIDYHINVIAKSCEELSCLGYEIGGIGGDVENISKSSVFGTDKVINYFSSKVEDFEHVIAVRGFQANTTTVSNRKQLRKKVQTKFQGLWYKASKKTSTIPYSKIKSGSIDLKVLGLPEGIEFKSPSDYSMKQLKQVLDANNVSFEIKKTQTEQIPSFNPVHARVSFQALPKKPVDIPTMIDVSEVSGLSDLDESHSNYELPEHETIEVSPQDSTSMKIGEALFTIHSTYLESYQSETRELMNWDTLEEITDKPADEAVTQDISALVEGMRHGNLRRKQLRKKLYKKK